MGETMRDYELVLIFHPALGDDAIHEKLERFHGLVSGGDAEIKIVDHWGGRQLAYPIQKQTSGYYVVTQFLGDPTALPELERIMRLDEEVLRYLLVLNEGEPSSGMSVLSAAAPALRPSEESAGDGDKDAGNDDEETEAVSRSRMSPPEFSGGRGHRRRIDGPPIALLNYKDVATLSRFITEQGKLLPRRTTRVAAGFQRKLGRAVKRARYLALLPYMRSHGG
jgi:small subunit ribosomal protein S6